MADVNQACASIIQKVIHSGLDFIINQTPYSIHFSLRRKFSKNSFNKIPLGSPHDESSPEITKIDRFRQELLHTRNEYVNLYTLYEAERDERCKLEVEYKKVIESKENIKSLKIENNSLKNKLETKTLELKQVKCELENVKKEKNTLSVALKTFKAEIKEQKRDNEKKVIDLEKKVVELYNFKQSKLAEDRELKIINRKEIKKAKQKLKREENSTKEDKNKNEKPCEAAKNADVQTIAMEDTKHEDPLEENPDGHNKSDFKAETDVILVGMEAEAVDENDEAFIGPRLPRLMTPEDDTGGPWPWPKV